MFTVTAQTYTKFSGVSPGNKFIQSTSKLLFLFACRVSYCVADPNITKVFAFISRVQGKSDLNCYAFLCSKESMVSRTWTQSYRSSLRSGALARGGCIRGLYEWLVEIKSERGYSCQVSVESSTKEKNQLRSLLCRGLFVSQGGWGEGKKKKARGGRWEGEREEARPLSIVPALLLFIDYCYFYCGGECQLRMSCLLLAVWSAVKWIASQIDKLNKVPSPK